MKKSLFLFIFMFICLSGFSQKGINDYKYIIVPKKFEFSSDEDQYQLNSILKFLFNKYGYIAYFSDDEMPEELKDNRCLALMSDVSKDKSGMFKTKLEIILKDCYDTEVMRSDVGESRLKQFDRAYSEALRDAFETFQELDYKYSSTKEVSAKKEKIDVAKVEEEVVEVFKKEQAIKETKKKVESVNSNNEVSIYNAKISGGLNYKLFNNEQKLVYMLLYTGKENVYMVKGMDAVVYKLNGNWVLAKNTDEKIEIQAIEINFN